MLELLNAIIRHLAIQHRYPSTLTTAPLTEQSPDLSNKSLDIGIDVDTNIDVKTIPSIYAVVNDYTNNTVNISIASTSIASTTATITIMNS